MSTDSRRFTVPFIFYLIILIALIYGFRTELFVTGLRLYVAAVNDPRAERLLGEYYQHNANLSNQLALSFYSSAFKKYKETLTNAKPDKEAIGKLQIGRIYLCGRGVPQNTPEAKRWFDEASKAADEATKQGITLPTQVNQDIKEGLAAAEQTSDGSGNGSSPTNPLQSSVCRFMTDPEFFIKTFNSAY